MTLPDIAGQPRFLSREGLGRCLQRSPGGATKSSAPRWNRGRSFMARSPRRPSCRWAGPTSSRRAVTGSSRVSQSVFSASPSGPTPGSSSCFRPRLPSRLPTGPRLAGSCATRSKRFRAYALLGVRACDLAAIAVQDRTFLDSEFGDPIYRRRREAALLVAVNCTQAAATCFCTSMGTGPRCRGGFDLALTEIDAGFILRGWLSARARDRRRLAPQRRRCADLDSRQQRAGNGPSTRFRADSIPRASAICCWAISIIPAGTTWRRAVCRARTARWFARPVFALRSTR